MSISYYHIIILHIAFTCAVQYSNLNECDNLNDSDFNNSIHKFKRVYRNKNAKIFYSKNIYIKALKSGKLISKHSKTLFCQMYFPCIDSKSRFVIEVLFTSGDVKLGDFRKQNKL